MGKRLNLQTQQWDLAIPLLSGIRAITDSVAPITAAWEAVYG
jgi:hypothetical protein